MPNYEFVFNLKIFRKIASVVSHVTKRTYVLNLRKHKDNKT